MNGINYALDNIQAGNSAGWGAGSAADQLPYNERTPFLSGVRMVESLSFEQKIAVQYLLNGSANAGDAQQLPARILAELRKRDSNLDYVLALLEHGKATLHLPPYED